MIYFVVSLCPTQFYNNSRSIRTPSLTLSLFRWTARAGNHQYDSLSSLLEFRPLGWHFSALVSPNRCKHLATLHLRFFSAARRHVYPLHPSPFPPHFDLGGLCSIDYHCDLLCRFANADCFWYFALYDTLFSVLRCLTTIASTNPYRSGSYSYSFSIYFYLPCSPTLLRAWMDSNSAAVWMVCFLLAISYWFIIPWFLFGWLFPDFPILISIFGWIFSRKTPTSKLDAPISLPPARVDGSTQPYHLSAASAHFIRPSTAIFSWIKILPDYFTLLLEYCNTNDSLHAPRLVLP